MKLGELFDIKWQSSPLESHVERKRKKKAEHVPAIDMDLAFLQGLTK